MPAEILFNEKVFIFVLSNFSVYTSERFLQAVIVVLLKAK